MLGVILQVIFFTILSCGAGYVTVWLISSGVEIICDYCSEFPDQLFGALMFFVGCIFFVMSSLALCEVWTLVYDVYTLGW